MLINYIILLPILILALNFFANKKNLFQSLSGEKHQLFVEKKNIPLTGGIVLILTSFFIIDFKFESYFLIFILIFLIGFFSDTKILKSAKKRFLIQTITIFLFILYYDLNLTNVRVFFFRLFFRI